MPSKLLTKYDYKCHYMTLANMLIKHGTDLCTANGPDDVRKLNEKAIADAKDFITRIEPPKPPEPDLSNVPEYRSA